MESLNPELRAALFTTEVGQMVHHPLVVMYYSDNMAGYANALLDQKRSSIQALVLEKKYEQIIWLFERPYRLNGFEQYGTLIEDDEEYWRVLAQIWTDSENIYENDATWRRLLNNSRSHRRAMMDDEEQAHYDALPEFVNVYRGTTADEIRPGLSWSLKRSQAEWFANRFGRNGQVVAQRVHKKNIVALKINRGEDEVIVL